MAARAVAVKTAEVGIPFSASAEKMLGLTARMYAIVRKVVTPAMISVRTLLTEGSNPNRRAYQGVFTAPAAALFFSAMAECF